MCVEHPVLKIKLKINFLIFKSVQAQALAWLNNVKKKLFHLNVCKSFSVVICPLPGLSFQKNADKYSIFLVQDLNLPAFRVRLNQYC